METAAIAPSPAWTEPAYQPTEGSSLAGLPPELQLLVTLARSVNTQTDTARLSVADAYKMLEALRDEIAEAMERAQEAQESAGILGDISSLLGSDIATIASVVASAALVLGSGGAGAAVVVAALAVGFTAGGEVAEELGVDPKVVMALKLAGAAAGLIGGNAASASQLWSTVHTGAKITEGAAIAGGGAAYIAEGQYNGAATEERGQATFLRNEEQLQSQLTDEQIARIEKLVEQLRFLTEAATTINANGDALNQSVIRRIGG